MAILLCLSFSLLAFSADIAGAWQHRRHVLAHEHLHRRALHATSDLAPATIASVTVPSATPADSKVLSDISQIAEGLHNLPLDLQAFFEQIQADVEKLKEELQALLGALGLISGTPTPSASPSSVGIPIGFPITPYVPLPTETFSVSLAEHPSLSRYLNASKSSKGLTTTIHRTSTIHRTHTVYNTDTSIAASSAAPDSEVNAPSHSISYVFPSATRTVSSASTPTFDPQAQDNVAAYYNLRTARDANTTMDSMQLLCDEPAINIINLAWLQTFVGPQYGAAPGYGIAFPCGSINCTAIGYQASLCQQKGKKVFVSLVVNSTHMVSVGGSNATTAGTTSPLLTSGEWANDFASGLLSTFSPSVSSNNPNGGSFGGLVADGFDIYPIGQFPVNTSSLAPGSNSTNIFLTSPYDVQFVKALRTQIQTQARTMYISAAPYCGASETPLSLDALRLVDFVFVRYLDTPGCSLREPSLDLGQSLHQWSSDLLGLTNGPGSTPAEFPGPGSSDAVDNGPRLFFGGMAPNGSAELDNNTVTRWQNLYQYLNPTNAPDQGGVMLWGAPEDIERQGRNGVTFAQYAKGRVGCLDADFRSVACASIVTVS